MKYKQLTLLLMSVLLLSFAVSFVSAYATDLNIVTANNTEFNTGTPTISVNITGNCTGYLANWTLNGVDVKTASAVPNATNTNIVATTSTTSGNSYVYNVTFYNTTCMGSDTNVTVNNNLEINARPTISAVSGNGGAFIKGQTITWTATWSDTNSTGTDTNTIYACKTDAFTTSCPGGEWGHSSAESDGSTALTYTVLTSDTAGTKKAYLYAIDDNSYASSSSTSGDFVISKYVEDEDESTTTTTTSTGSNGIAWLIAIVIVVVLLAVLLKKK